MEKPEPYARDRERELKSTDGPFLGYLFRKLEEQIERQGRKLDVLLALVAALLDDPDLSPEDKAAMLARLKADTKKILAASKQLTNLAAELDSHT